MEAKKQMEIIMSENELNQVQVVENNFLEVLKIIFKEGVHISTYQEMSQYLPNIKDHLQFIHNKTLQDYIDLVVFEIIECEKFFDSEREPELYDEFQKCYNEANRLRTPWFLGEIMMKNKLLSEFIMKDAEIKYNENVRVKWTE